MMWINRTSGCVAFPVLAVMICGVFTFLFTFSPSNTGATLASLCVFVVFGLPIIFVLSLVTAPFARRRTYKPYTGHGAKRRLAEQSDSGTPEEVQSFEALLARTKRKRK